MMMEVVYVAVAALSLLSVGQSAPVMSCETLIQPLVIPGRDQLLGKWVFVAESTTIPGSRLLTNLLADSAWSKMTAANEIDAMDLYQVQKIIGRCYSLKTELTLHNSTLTMEHPYPAAVILLSTGCSDCLVLYSRITLGSAFSGLQLLSRRRGVSVAEKQEFLKQVECLNLPAPAFLDPEKGLCPDDSLSLESETTDMMSAVNDMTSKWSSMLANITSAGGLDTLIKLFSK
ncbi:unnamed protein product [Pleuronectes platessa]|uniref:Apolipoprotein M n=1 Tax=Pleuronectes platessa TaxID=8262 RepID=A0A9N7YVH4_PLEPL|nr:uncharacterized protein LOC128432777 [Pleuronectes platessa]CAB1439917.1 unnamed protein product [Pleuronectes platessa]